MSTCTKILVLFVAIYTIGCAPKPQNDAAIVDSSYLTPCTKVASKNLLIIGDSISMGYTSHLQHDLCGYYNVQHTHYPQDWIDKGYTNGAKDQNAQGTTFTLANLDRWLSQAGPQDVIVWNNGLWNARDPSYDTSAPGNATDLDTYKAELIEIAQKLQTTGARVIFFTTTDIPMVEFYFPDGHAFLPGRDVQENTVAVQVMNNLGVEHYDLWALAAQNPKLHPTDDPIHFNTQGYSLLGEFVSDMVTSNYEHSN